MQQSIKTFAALCPKLLAVIPVLSLLLLNNAASGQSFLKLVSSKQLDANYCRDIIQTSDGGYILAGGADVRSDTSYDNARGFMAKLNASGDTMWTKRFESGCQVWNGLVPTSDGNFLSLGAYDVSGQVKASMVKFDNSGAVIWQKKMSDLLGIYALSCGVLAKDGSNVVAGISANLFVQDAGVFIAKVNSAGTFTWTQVITTTGVNLLPASIKELANGGFVITGVSTANENDIFVMKVDANGTLVWSKTFGGADNDTGADVIETPDKGFLIAGSTASAGNGLSDFALTKLDSNGNLLWTKTYGGKANDLAFSMIPYDNGNYLIMGLTDSYNSTYYDNYLLITDGNGNVQQSKRVTSDAGPELLLTHPQIIKNSDGAYVIGANFVNTANGAPSIDFGILKFDKNFSSCLPVADAPYVEGTGMSFYNSSFSSASRGGTSNLTANISSGGLTTTVCALIPVTNIKEGYWSDPSIWSNNKVPSATDQVSLNFDVIVDINADCWSLTTNNRQVYVSANVKMNIHGK